MIRPATLEDIPACMDLLAGLRDAVEPEYEFSHAKATDVLCRLVRGADGYLAVLDIGGPQGMLAAVRGQATWGHDTVVDELAWFIRPAYRGRWGNRMLRDLEAWAAGARVSINHAGREAGRFYERAGYSAELVKYSKVT